MDGSGPVRGCEHTFSPLWLSAAEHSHPYPATTCKKAEKITRQGFDKVIGDVKASKSKESHGAITLSAIEGALAKTAEEDEQLSQQNHEHMKIIAENGPIATALGYRVSSQQGGRTDKAFAQVLGTDQAVSSKQDTSSSSKAQSSSSTKGGSK